jgi:hypothetical protein
MLRPLAQIAGIGISLAILPCAASAQRGGGVPMAAAPAPHAMSMPMAAPVMHAAPMRAVAAARPVAHVGAPVGGHPVAPHHPLKPAMPRPPARNYPVPSNPVFNNGVIFPNNSFGDGGYPVPGLGFDYVHFAAVHPGVFRHHFHGGAIVPFIGGGGIYVPVEYYPEPAPQAEQPAETAAEQEQTQPEQQNSSAPMVSAPSRERPVASAPLPPLPEFIFVRRDGTVFFAVAYSWINGSLQYITQDGLRKVTPLDSLDLDATSQFNEQRGLSFRSPA